jgi:hypothetical protein
MILNLLFVLFVMTFLAAAICQFYEKYLRDENDR